MCSQSYVRSAKGPKRIKPEPFLYLFQVYVQGHEGSSLLAFGRVGTRLREGQAYLG